MSRVDVVLAAVEIHATANSTGRLVGVLWVGAIIALVAVILVRRRRRRRSKESMRILSQRPKSNLAEHVTVPKHRRSRDSALGWAAAALAVTSSVRVVSHVLGLIDTSETHQLVGFRIAEGCALIYQLVLVSAFGLGSVAFLFDTTRRARRLEVAATLAAAGATVSLLGAVAGTAVSISHQYPRGYIAIGAFGVGADFAVVLTALAVSKAFSAVGNRGSGDLAQRDWRLGWASIGLASSYALTIFYQIGYISFYFRYGLTDAFSFSIFLSIIGGAIVLVGSVIGSFAFFGSHRRQRQGVIDWRSKRDARLRVAVATFAVGFLFIGLGEIRGATVGLVTTRGYALDSAKIAGYWLGGIAWLGVAAACVCARVGFSRSRDQPGFSVGDTPRAGRTWDPRDFSDQNRPKGWYIDPTNPSKMRYWGIGDSLSWVGATRTPRRIRRGWRKDHG